MGKKKTHEEYVNELFQKNPNIDVVDIYLGAKIKILHKCKIHKFEWLISPSMALSGQGCPKCKSDKLKQAKTKSHEQYLQELKNINSSIVPVEKYKGANTSIFHKCIIDDYVWKAKPANLLNDASGCPKCSQRFRRTNDDYINEIHEKFQNIEPLEVFKGMLIPILHRCNIHNIEWKSTPSNILKGHGCKQCGIEKTIHQTKRTSSEYITEVNKINPNIIVLEEYINSSTPIMHKCLIDNYEWKTAPGNIMSGKGCPMCGGTIKRTHDEYQELVRKKNSNIEVVENYINAKTPILHKCLIHNVIWKASPSSILHGCGCNICTKEKIGNSNRRTHEEYITELNSINPNIYPIEKYINALTPILHKCKIDGNEWNTPPARILQGFGCPKCNSSKGESVISLWLDKHDISYEIQKRFSDCRDIKPLPFDFYIPDYNLCIEYDGEQHFRPVDYFGGKDRLIYQQNHDKIKENYCKSKGINLLRIPYNKNIEEELDNFLFN